MEDFPRGGSNVLSAEDIQKVKDSAEQDFLFGKTSKEGKKRKLKDKSKSKKGGKKDTWDSTVGILDTASGRVPIRSLHYKLLTEKQLLLGNVKEQSRNEIIINLPNSLLGHIENRSMIAVPDKEELNEDDEDSDIEMEEGEITQLSDSLPPGSFIPVAIMNVDMNKTGSKKVKLSADPQDVNFGLRASHCQTGMMLWGSVTEVEDHGYSISFGLKEIAGFLPKAETTGSLKLHQLLWLAVVKVTGNGRLVTVTNKPEQISASMIKTGSKLGFSALRPGALVKATVAKIESEGAYIAFCGFEGIVHYLHLPHHGAPGKSVVKVNQKVDARVMSVNPFTKSIGLSMLGPVVSFERFKILEEDYLGLIKECVVISYISKVLVSFDKDCYGISAVSSLKDKDPDKEKKYKTGKKKRGRIIGYNSLDGLFVLSFDKSVIEQPFLRYHDLKLGQVVQGTIITVESFGMLVRIADHIRGLVPTLHLADIKLKHPEKKLVDGKKVKCRVIKVVPGQKKLILTHKKTMVASDLKLLTSYGEVAQGDLAHGFVVSVKDYGLVVKFYGDVHGLIRRRNLGVLKTEKTVENFVVGQVVKCLVISCDPAEKKLDLKLVVGKESSKPPRIFKFREIVKGKFLRLENNGLWLQLDDNQEEVWVPTYHMTDANSNRSALTCCLNALPSGTEIGNIMCMGKDKQNRDLFTMKKFLQSRPSEISCFDDLKVGQALLGVITHVVKYGVFVEVVPGLTGLVPIAHLADAFVAQPSLLFSVGQTVCAKVTEIDNDKRRFLLTMKPSELGRLEDGTVPLGQAVVLLHLCLEERQRVMSLFSTLPDSAEHRFFRLASQLLGSVQTVKVEKSLTEGLVVQTQEGVDGEVPRPLMIGVNTEVGDTIKCFVVDADLEKRRFIAVAVPEIVERRIQGKTPMVKVGKETQGTICWITEDYVVATLDDLHHVFGYIPAKEHLNDTNKAASKFTVGQKMLLKVDQIIDGLLLLKCVNDPSKKSYETGDIVSVTVNSIQEMQLNVSVKGTKIHGRIHISECLDEVKEGQQPLKSYNQGDSILARVLGFRDFKTHKYLPISHQSGTKALLEFSARPSILQLEDIAKLPKPKVACDYEMEQKVTGFVKGIAHNGILMTVGPQVNGFLPLLLASDREKVLSKLKKHFKDGSACLCTVSKHLEKERQLELSKIGSVNSLVQKGKICLGKVVKTIKDHALLVELPGHKCGYVHITNVSDTYEESPLLEFAPGKVVRVYILSIKDDGHIDLSLRKSRLNNMSEVEVKDPEIHALDDIKEGRVLRGFVKSISDVGVFVSLSPSIVGRVKIKDLSTFFIKHWKPHFPPGKLLTVKVTSINPQNNHIELSCRTKDTGVPDPVQAPKRKRNDSQTIGGKRTKYELDSDGEEKNAEIESGFEDEDEVQVDEKEALPKLQMSSKFNWSAQEDEAKEEMEENIKDDANDKGAQKASKRQKRAQMKAEEEFVHKAELALLDTERGPENADDFDRLVLGSPNSSILWIQYIAFHLHSAEIEKARGVVQRALKTISFREEQEKFNVWVAWMNLENMYGTQETLNQVFQDAVKLNDSKKVHMQLSNIYIRTKKYEQAEKLYQTMLKKFNSSKKVWIAFAAFLMKTGKTENARKLLDRALKAIPKHKHVETILKFATMEFKDGEPERGRTIFESLVKTYPKRTDVWSIYIDMLLKQNDVDAARNIFDRVTALTLSSKKMKAFFKRYLDFEKKHGDPLRVEQVKSKALEYVENKMNLT